MKLKQSASIAILASLLFTACSDGNAPNGTIDDNRSARDSTADNGVAADAQDVASSGLAGTRWELLKIQSMDDSEWTPDDPSRYTLNFEPDGRAYMKFDCNNGNGGWSSEGASQVSFTPVASTNALCQDNGLGERYASQFEYVRSYVLRDGHLFLATMADGAIIEFRPAK